MFKKFLKGTLLFNFLFSIYSCEVKLPSDLPPTEPVSHRLWDELVKSHVSERGLVDYQGFIRDSARLQAYLDVLSSRHPNPETWSEEARMAYWINAYNAFTVKLILDYYPVESIKDIKSGIPFINTVWDIKFIEIQGQTYDLNNIEHGILRSKFEDARIHGALNCASMSCPRLRAEAYVENRLDEQLDDAMHQFINDPELNRVGKDKAELSKIFSWYKGDFLNEAPSLRDYINRYAETELRSEGEITFLDYSWELNEAK